MLGAASPVVAPPVRHKRQQDLLLDDTLDVPLVLVAHDLSPADMLQFKQSVFAGFVTDVGGKTSHTAIVARSMDIPAVVGARSASQLIRQDDWIIIDGDAGVVIVDPSPIILAEYGFRQRQGELERERLSRLRNTAAITLDGQRIELLANIEMPDDTLPALKVGAVGVGLFRSEFLFMGRHGRLPDEEEQYQAYRRAVEGMQGLPVTIRTVDVGADKPLDDAHHDDAHLNPALGLRAIRWSLADPAMFLTQLRAILRAAAHGQVNLLIPMLAHGSEIRQTLSLIDHARVQLDNQGMVYGPLKLGAMIEIPAAALTLKLFLKYFDFLSIGTNDLIQYTLAIDRADESVAHLYDPLHPAVLRLVADTIAECNAQGKGVSVCGEMAGDTALTRLLLGLGLRSFSMHPRPDSGGQAGSAARRHWQAAALGANGARSRRASQRPGTLTSSAGIEVRRRHAGLCGRITNPAADRSTRVSVDARQGLVEAVPPYCSPSVPAGARPCGTAGLNRSSHRTCHG
jgi:phosphotransferase system enzyme I (PtsI)